MLQYQNIDVIDIIINICGCVTHMYVYIYKYQRISIDLFIQLISRETERERERENRDWLNHETIYTYNIGISCRCRFIICTSTE